MMEQNSDKRMHPICVGPQAVYRVCCQGTPDTLAKLNICRFRNIEKYFNFIYFEIMHD